jgi:hypothetical protein
VRSFPGSAFAGGRLLSHPRVGPVVGARLLLPAAPLPAQCQHFSTNKYQKVVTITILVGPRGAWRRAGCASGRPRATRIPSSGPGSSRAGLGAAAACSSSPAGRDSTTRAAVPDPRAGSSRHRDCTVYDTKGQKINSTSLFSFFVGVCLKINTIIINSDRGQKRLV